MDRYFLAMKSFFVSLVLFALSTTELANGQNYDIVKRSDALFTWKLYNLLRKEKRNIYISPLSLNYQLTQLALGAGNETYNQLLTALSLPYDEEAILNSYKASLNYIANNVNLNFASRMFVDNVVQIKEDYLSLIQDYFYSNAEYVNFNQQPEETRIIINKFIAEHTDDTIPDFYRQGDITSAMVAIVLSAVSFQNEWIPENDMYIETQETFYGENNHEYQIDFIYATTELVYKRDEHLGAFYVLLPFKNGFTLELLIPEVRNGIHELEQKVLNQSYNISSPFDFSHYEVLEKQRITLGLPKFTLQKTYQFKEILSKIGVVDLFDPKKVDLNRITSQTIPINDIVQKSYINFTVKGAKSGDATGVKDESIHNLLPLVEADHPFLFAIRHDTSQIPFFIGRFMNPQRGYRN